MPDKEVPWNQAPFTCRICKEPMRGPYLDFATSDAAYGEWKGSTFIVNGFNSTDSAEVTDEYLECPNGHRFRKFEMEDALLNPKKEGKENE